MFSVLPKIPPTIKGPIILFLAATCIGLAPIGLRLSAMEPAATATWRFALALPILLIASRIFKQRIGRPNRAIILAGIFLALDMCIWHSALVRTSVANATFIVNLGSIAVGLLAWVFLKQRPSLIWPFAALLALIGAAAMAFGAPTEQGGNLAGDALAILAAFCLTGYLLSATVARKDKSGFQVIFWMTVTTIPVAAIFALIMGENLIPKTIQDLSAPFFLAAFAQSLGQGLIVYGMGLTKASVGGVILLTQAVVAGLIAWPLFGEALALIQIIGAAFILLGVWLAGRRN